MLLSETVWNALSMCLLTVNTKEATPAAILTIADAQLRKRDKEGFCDNCTPTLTPPKVTAQTGTYSRELFKKRGKDA